MKYNIESIIELSKKGEKLEYLFFWGHQKSQDGVITKSCLSQWWKADFEEDNIRYNSAEHYMMVQKAMLFGDQEIMNIMIKKSNPKEIKALGRKVKNFNQEKWDLNKYQIVLKANILKFGQNKELKEFLLNTQKSIIVEASPVDRIWGVGLAEDNKNIKNPANWKGENLLGFALMEVRDALKD